MIEVQNVKLGTLISIFFFGMIGGTLRYLLGLKLASTGTILVNLIGSFCLAFLIYYVIERQKLPAWLSTGLGTGMVGAFTTFSTFTVDVLGLSTFTDATFYLLISVVGGFLLAYTGMILGIKLGKVGDRR
ncbi:fluoride efflux transporter FluC [Ligilactobacillus salivarius]|uniref:fluoride efflux transporter FluC n=1 Tax=Ligilactobacillus salivarius TaxID=1624 RepID=UPI0032ECAFD3